jgi:hypothetical protein
VDDASAVSSPTDESSLVDGHRPAPPPPDGVSPSAEPMSAKVARLLAHGFPH